MTNLNPPIQTSISTSSGFTPISTSAGVMKGIFAVVLFALTVPMTKMALPLFSPELIAASRATFAGLLALIVININGWSLPHKKTLIWLVLAGAGIVIGFPYLLSYSLINLSAANMGIVLAGLPIITSVCAALIMGERYTLRFWLSSGVGAGLLAVYFINGSQYSGWDLKTLGILVAVLAFGGLGYSAGAKAAKSIGGWQTICWILVLYLPFSAISFGYYAGDEVFILEPANLNWSMDQLLAESKVPVNLYKNMDDLLHAIVSNAQPGDHILMMSNGSFGGIHELLQQQLA